MQQHVIVLCREHFGLAKIWSLTPRGLALVQSWVIAFFWALFAPSAVFFVLFWLTGCEPSVCSKTNDRSAPSLLIRICVVRVKWVTAQGEGEIQTDGE